MVSFRRPCRPEGGRQERADPGFGRNLRLYIDLFTPASILAACLTASAVTLAGGRKLSATTLSLEETALCFEAKVRSASGMHVPRLCWRIVLLGSQREERLHD